jgi:hypothetical protein
MMTDGETMSPGPGRAFDDSVFGRDTCGLASDR